MSFWWCFSRNWHGWEYYQSPLLGANMQGNDAVWTEIMMAQYHKNVFSQLFNLHRVTHQVRGYILLTCIWDFHHAMSLLRSGTWTTRTSKGRPSNLRIPTHSPAYFLFQLSWQNDHNYLRIRFALTAPFLPPQITPAPKSWLIRAYIHSISLTH